MINISQQQRQRLRHLRAASMHSDVPHGRRLTLSKQTSLRQQTHNTASLTTVLLPQAIVLLLRCRQKSFLTCGCTVDLSTPACANKFQAAVFLCKLIPCSAHTFWSSRARKTGLRPPGTHMSTPVQSVPRFAALRRHGTMTEKQFNVGYSPSPSSTLCTPSSLRAELVWRQAAYTT